MQGYHGDTSTTFFCGDVDEEARNLVKVIICTLISKEYYEAGCFHLKKMIYF